MRTQWDWDVECLTSNWCSEMWIFFSIVADTSPSNGYSVTHLSEPSNRPLNYDLHILAFPHAHILLFSLSAVSDSLWPHGLQQPRLPCPLPSPGACITCSLNRWCHSTILSSVVPFSSCLLSFPASGAFPVSWLFASGGQSTGASASASVLSMNIQDWFPLGLTGLISLQSKGLSRVFSNTTVQKHQFLGTHLSL